MSSKKCKEDEKINWDVVAAYNPVVFEKLRADSRATRKPARYSNIPRSESTMMRDIVKNFSLGLPFAAVLLAGRFCNP